MPLKKRDFRHIIQNEKNITIVFPDNTYIEARLQDVSVTGLCLEAAPTAKRNKISKDLVSCEIFLNTGGNEPLVLKGRVCRWDDEAGSEWLGVELSEKLEPTELSILRSNQESAFELAKVDKSIVQREALQIKVCASNYFIWTIGILLPLISTVWTLSIQGNIQADSTSVAMVSIFLVYCMSAFSSLEKSRAIYKRESFISAIDTYLIRGIAPPDYRGWLNLKYNLAECSAKRRADACPRKKSEPTCRNCKYVGEEKAKLNQYKKVVHSILDSFISLTSVFYTILFVIIVLLIAFYLSRYFSETYNQIILSKCLKVFAFSFVVGGVLFGRHTVLLLISFALSILIFLSVVINPSISNNLLSDVSYYLILSFIGILGFITASVGNILAGQLILLRKRQYSFESQFYMWLNILEKCKFIPDYQIIDKPENATTNRYLKSLTDFAFFGRGEID